MYGKMLIIGLGGSGGKTLRFLKRDLRRWIAQPGRKDPDQVWTGGIPEGWQFLHIDTPTEPDGLEAGGEPLTEREYVGLVGEGVSLHSVMNKLDNVPGGEVDLASWRVDPYRTKVPLGIGAGQFRAVGRTVGLAYSDVIRERLDSAVARLRASDAQPQLNRLYEHVHGESAGGNSGDPQAIVISSLAGGTGAGLLLDVFDILYSVHGPFRENTLGLFYTPDAFTTAANQGGLSPNSLAAISEVVNGAWWNGTGASENAGADELLEDVPGKRSLITKHIARTSRPLQASGAYCNYLIGGTNAEGNDASMDNGLFAMVGGALLSWLTDVKSGFVSYEIANWQSNALRNMPDTSIRLLVNRGKMGESGPPMFSALGFARVSVGTDYLRRYAAQMIAKEAATHLREAHDRGDRGQRIKEQGVVNPKRIVELLVEDERERFEYCMDLFDRHDPDRGQPFDLATRVSQDLLPPEAVATFEEQTNRILGEVQDLTLNADGWAAELEPYLQDARAELEVQARRGLSRMVDGWVRRAVEVIPRAVEAEAGEHGILVAHGLVGALRRAIMDPNDGAVARLARQAPDSRAYASVPTMVEHVREQLRMNIGDGKAGLSNVQVGEAIRGAMAYAWGAVEGELADRAEQLLTSFASGLLRPLEDALTQGSTGMASTEKELGAFPDYGPGTPPQALLPPESEFTVIEPREFFEEFQRLMAATYADRTAGGSGMLDAWRDVRRDVACGASIRQQLVDAPGDAEMTRELRGLAMLQFDAEWRPGYEVLGGSPTASSAQSARITARVTPTEFEKRADHWLGRRGFPFQQFLDQDLRSYTKADNPADDDVHPYPERQSRVLAKIDQAVAAAAPLVQIDETLKSVVHPDMGEGSAGYRITLSTLPFRLHPLEERIKERMKSTVYADRTDQKQFEKTLTQDSDLRYIDVISTLASPIYPWLIPSLMMPIAEEWNEGNPAHSVFWNLRRARPVREFIPAPQAHIRAMLRGWFTAEALGLLTFEGQRARIVHDADGDSPRIVGFPSPTLEPAEDDLEWDRVVTLLESLALVMPEVARTTSLDPFRPYVALRDLGMSEPTQDRVLAYRSLNPVLRAWIATGEVASGAVTGATPLPELAVLAGPEERRTALIDRFEGLRADLDRRYTEYLRRTREKESLLSDAPLWPGLRMELDVALLALVRALRADTGRA